MKSRLLFGLAVGLSSLASLASAQEGCILPGPNPINGTPCSSSTNIFTSAPDLFAPDLFTYVVGEDNMRLFLVPGVTGDVVLCEPGMLPCDETHPENWSDVLRFVFTGNMGSAILFSNPEEPASPAVNNFDTNLTNFVLAPNHIFRNEEGLNGNAYTDTQNGLVYNNGASIGTILSDVPEPSSPWLFGSALVVVAGFARRRLTNR